MGGRVAAYLVSNRGPQFASQLLNATCRQWGEIQKLTTAYHLQTNLTERVNKTLKIMIASRTVIRIGTCGSMSSGLQSIHLGKRVQTIPQRRLLLDASWKDPSNYSSIVHLILTNLHMKLTVSNFFQKEWKRMLWKPRPDSRDTTTGRDGKRSSKNGTLSVFVLTWCLVQGS